MPFTEPIAFLVASGHDTASAPSDIVTGVRTALRTHDAVYIRSDEEVSRRWFEILINQMGTPLTSDVTSPDPEYGPTAHRVESAPTGTVVDKFGKVPLSATSVDIDFHTDDYFENSPADVILYRCIRPAPVGGLTRLAFLNQILPLLSDDVLDELQRANYPTYTGRKAVLLRRDGTFTISIHQSVISRAVQDGAVFEERARDALNAFMGAVHRSAITLRLSENDILAVDNRTVLHARTSFDADSSRLILRTKLLL